MFKSLFSNSCEYLKRFHLSIFSSFLFFICMISMIHGTNIKENILFIISCVLLYSTLFFTGLKLFIESRKRSLYMYYVLSIIAFVLIFIYFYPALKSADLNSSYMLFSKMNENFLYFFGVASFLFIFVAPFFRKESNDDELTTFNHDTWSQLFFSFLGSSILLIGSFIILYSLNSLLKINIKEELYFDLALFAYSIFFPIFFLSGVPKNFHEIKTKYPNGIKYICMYVLIPILHILYLVFVIYALQLIFTGNFSISESFVHRFYFYAFAGILTYIISYPFRNEDKFISFFYKNFFKLLIFPTILGCIHLYSQIVKNGFTEYEYFALLFISWVVLSIIVRFLSKQNYIKNISIATVALLFTISFSPLHVGNVTEMSKMHLLKNLLQKTHSQEQINPVDEKKIKDIVRYMIRRNKIKSLEKLLGDKVNLSEIKSRSSSYYVKDEDVQQIFDALRSQQQ